MRSKTPFNEALTPTILLCKCNRVSEDTLPSHIVQEFELHMSAVFYHCTEDLPRSATLNLPEADVGVDICPKIPLM